MTVYQANIDHGIRASCDWAYLRPATGRRNLEIMPDTQVRRIILGKGRAEGVKVVTRGVEVDLFAARETIISCGTYESPKLLMLSGIGDKARLAAVGVDIRNDLPGVGRNLQDHPCVPVGYHARVKGVSLVGNFNVFEKARIGAEWLFFRKGLGATNFWEVGSFFKSGENADYCDIRHEFIPMIGDFTHGSTNVSDGFLYQTALMRPESRGGVTLTSQNPADRPSIVHNYLQHPDDVTRLAGGVRGTLEMIRQKAWSDMAVVDQQGRVHGMDSLRVVDSSIIPRVTSGNLNAPIIMVAEKIAAAISARA